MDKARRLSLLNQFEKGIDTEHWMFAAASTNLYLQMGWERLFDLTTLLAAPGAEVKTLRQPGVDHNWSVDEMSEAYKFLEDKLRF